MKKIKKEFKTFPSGKKVRKGLQVKLQDEFIRIKRGR